MPQRKMKLTSSKWTVSFLCAQAFLTISGLALLLYSAELYEVILNAILKFGPGSIVSEAWQKPPDPIIINVYVFNWTNPEDIDKPNVKPKFVQVGPYRYKHTKEKTDVVWNEHNSTVTYKYLKYFYFDEENSPRHHSDVITTINSVAVAMAHIAHDWHLVPQTIITTTIRDSPLHVTVSVKELLFGYEDSALSVVNSIPFFTDTERNKYGILYGMNGTIGNEGVFNMKFSKGDEYGTIQNWNYNNHTRFYKDHCGQIHGSGGEIFSRNMKPTFIQIFSTEMCRTAKLNFVGNVTVKEISGYKFSPGVELFDNGSKLEQNVCYDNEFPSGLLNVTACREHAPLYLSLPHFYYADPSYLNAVEGLHPDKDKHEFYVTIEPKTGVVIDLAAKIQLNFQLQPMPRFRKFSNLPNVLFPVMWLEQIVVASDELASNVKLLIQLPSIIRTAGVVLVALGVSCILSVVVYINCFKMKKKPVVQQEEVPLNSKPLSDVWNVN